MQIKEVIVVEGKTDTALLKSILDVDTIETNGSGITEETLQFIKETNEKRGIIVFTDPDFPGNQIRNKVMQVAPNCKHAFIEKSKAIAKGKVGVAEASKEDVLKALENVVTLEENKDSILWNDFINLDIIGNKKRRIYLYDYFNLGYGNVKQLYKRMNMLGIEKDDIIKALSEDKHE